MEHYRPDIFTALCVDIATGMRSVLSGPSVGSGPTLQSIDFLALGPDGSLIASGTDAIYSVNPSTGARKILAGTSFRTGLNDGLYREAAIVVPEPSTLGIAALASLILISRRFQRSSSGREF